MARDRENGMALILAVLLTLALSAITASLMLVGKTESWSGMNYRMLAQARYGAEAGMHRGLNYLLNNYTPPGGPADPLANYNTAVTPVTYNGKSVVLSSMNGVAANYPVTAVASGFQVGSPGNVVADTFTVNYASYATLLSMRQVTPYGTTTPVTIQTWQITGAGSITGTRNATQEVSAILETPVTPAFNYSVFSTASGCGALAFSGGGTTDSYNSTAIQWVNGQVVTQASGGNVGTNGNLAQSGNPTTINGSLSTPRTGVGPCANGSVPAWTLNGQAQVTGGVVELPQSVSYPTPALPSPLPPTTNTTINSNTTLAPGSYDNLNVTAGGALHLTAGTYAINSITLTGGATLVVDSGPVILNVAGQNQTTPIDFTGGTMVNSAVNPGLLQIQYAGTGAVNVSGNAKAAALLNAPNASVKITGGSDWYGAIIAGTCDDTGGAKIHYDRNLQNSFLIVGNPTLTSFTWKKY